MGHLKCVSAFAACIAYLVYFIYVVCMKYLWNLGHMWYHDHSFFSEKTIKFCSICTNWQLWFYFRSFFTFLFLSSFFFVCFFSPVTANKLLGTGLLRKASARSKPIHNNHNNRKNVQWYIVSLRIRKMADSIGRISFFCRQLSTSRACLLRRNEQRYGPIYFFSFCGIVFPWRFLYIGR